MHSIEEALAVALGLTQPLDGELVLTAIAQGRTLREVVTAGFDVPAAPTSMMDGYAIKSGGPLSRRVVDESAAGAPSMRWLEADEAAPISTGALLPPGADSVVPVEETMREGEDVHLLTATRPGKYTRAIGSDLHEGETLLVPGERLGATAVALLAGQGRSSVQVARRPIVTVFSLGEELRLPGANLAPGELFDSNGPSLVAACEEAGAEGRLQPLVPDQLPALVTALRGALSADLIVTSGGASVGAHDHLRAAIKQAGGEVLLWKVAMKPGKPLVLGRIERTAIVGLPGNPVSALVSFYLFVRPLLLRMLGRDPIELRRVRLPLGAALPTIGARRELLRARIGLDATGQNALWPEARQASSSLLGLHAADALIDCPANATGDIGALFEAILLPER